MKNISEQTTKEELFDVFNAYGNVLTITISPSQIGNEAIVEFDSPLPIDKACQATGYELNQKRLIVSKYFQQK